MGQDDSPNEQTNKILCYIKELRKELNNAKACLATAKKQIENAEEWVDYIEENVIETDE